MLGPLLTIPNVLTLVVLAVIVMDLPLSQDLKQFINSKTGRVGILVALAVIAYHHHLLGVVGFIAFYELLRKSSKKVSFNPKDAVVDFLKEETTPFEMTLEEEMVAKMVPLTKEKEEIKSNVQPLLEDLHSASEL
jgi:hypothetical protein